MFAACLTVAQRECINELANRDFSMKTEEFRNAFDQEAWLSNEDLIVWMTTEHANFLLSIWDIITPK